MNARPTRLPRLPGVPVTRTQARRALQDMVTIGDLAKRLGIPAQTVWNWTYRDQTFPKAVGRLAIANVYWWPEVEAWLASTGRATA